MELQKATEREGRQVNSYVYRTKRKKIGEGGGGGGALNKLYSVSRGLVQKVSDPQFSHFVAPSFPIINDRSLSSTKNIKSYLPQTQTYLSQT